MFLKTINFQACCEIYSWFMSIFSVESVCSNFNVFSMVVMCDSWHWVIQHLRHEDFFCVIINVQVLNAKNSMLTLSSVAMFNRRYNSCKSMVQDFDNCVQTTLRMTEFAFPYQESIVTLDLNNFLWHNFLTKWKTSNIVARFYLLHIIVCLRIFSVRSSFLIK